MANQAVIGDESSGRYIRIWQGGGFKTAGLALKKYYQDPASVGQLMERGDRGWLHSQPMAVQGFNGMRSVRHENLDGQIPPGEIHHWQGDFWTHPDINNSRWHFRYLYRDGIWFCGADYTDRVGKLVDVLELLFDPPRDNNAMWLAFPQFSGK